jgi:tRNA pseudouridine55 synthase
LDKEYVGELSLGFSTDTYDITGIRKHKSDAKEISLTLLELNRIAQNFVGEIEQIPPRFSALKRNGRKLYELSRQDKPVKIEPRKVSVKSLEINSVDLPLARFRSSVGKGAYIRSLVHDFGNKLNCGATLVSLRRVRIGNYHVADAQKLGDILEPMTC